MKTQTIVLSNYTELKLTFGTPNPYPFNRLEIKWEILIPVDDREPRDSYNMINGEMSVDSLIYNEDEEAVCGKLSDMFCVLCDVKPYRNDGTMKFEGDCRLIHELAYEMDGKI